MLFISFSLLKQMKKDESFTKFLDIKRGAAMHTLESLMLLPVREGERERERASSYTLFINHMYCSYRISNIIKYLFSKQVQRVSDYKRYLTQLLSLTHRNHPDYQNIKVTVGRTEEVLQYLIMTTCGVHVHMSLLLFVIVVVFIIRLYKQELMSYFIFKTTQS